MELSSGDKVDNYEIIREIGQGGGGIVFLARHTVLDQKRVLKFLRMDVGVDSDIDRVERFIDEATAIAQIDHPSIVDIYDCKESDLEGKPPFIAQEFVDGYSLRKWVSRTKAKISSGEAKLELLIEAMKKILEGVAAVHGEDMVHRDLKPENILIEDTKEDEVKVKIIDFGLVKKLTQEDGALTKQGFYGTPHYLPPEQAVESFDIGKNTDIYSLGVLFYWMFSGSLPYDVEEKDPMEIVMKHASEDVEFTSLHEEGMISEEIKPSPDASGVTRTDFRNIIDMIEKALSYNPEDRFSDAESFKRSLVNFISTSLEDTQEMGFANTIQGLETNSAQIETEDTSEAQDGNGEDKESVQSTETAVSTHITQTIQEHPGLSAAVIVLMTTAVTATGFLFWFENTANGSKKKDAVEAKYQKNIAVAKRSTDMAWVSSQEQMRKEIDRRRNQAVASARKSLELAQTDAKKKADKKAEKIKKQRGENQKNRSDSTEAGSSSSFEPIGLE
ncbi:MAG: serine/threonine protein kinase [Candidatus Magasanikbacteria bacterium]